MPVSNGQITARDIRQKAVKTHHLVDDAVATAKIQDVAVTVEKLDDPPWVQTFTASPVAGVNLTNILGGVALCDLTFDIPAWVGTVSLHASARLQVENASGAAQTYWVTVGINGEASASMGTSNWSKHTASNNGDVVSIQRHRVVTVSSPGATVAFESYGLALPTGASGTFAELSVFAIGTR